MGGCYVREGATRLPQEEELGTLCPGKQRSHQHSRFRGYTSTPGATPRGKQNFHSRELKPFSQRSSGYIITSQSHCPGSLLFPMSACFDKAAAPEPQYKLLRYCSGTLPRLVRVTKLPRQKTSGSPTELCCGTGSDSSCFLLRAVFALSLLSSVTTHTHSNTGEYFRSWQSGYLPHLRYIKNTRPLRR